MYIYYLSIFNISIKGLSVCGWEGVALFQSLRLQWVTFHLRCTQRWLAEYRLVCTRHHYNHEYLMRFTDQVFSVHLQRREVVHGKPDWSGICPLHQNILNNAGLMLGHRLRRWPNIKPALCKCIAVARRPVSGPGFGNLESEYCFTAFSAQSWQYRDRSKPRVWIRPHSYRSTQYNRQHCTLQAFEQFYAMYMHNFDNKHSARKNSKLSLSMLESSTSEFRTTTGHVGRRSPHWNRTICIMAVDP